MRRNIILIDFENVKPESLDCLGEEHFRTLVFVGANQTKLPFDVAASLQRLGARAEYVKISGNGANALDFHIAYYIGKLAALDPAAYFHIVSKDAGFDPLIAHLKENKILAGRVQRIADIPAVQAATRKPAAERVEIVLQSLQQPKATKPRTLKSLGNAVANLFQKQLSEPEIADIIEGMVKAGAISIDGAKVIYSADIDDDGDPGLRRTKS